MTAIGPAPRSSTPGAGTAKWRAAPATLLALLALHLCGGASAGAAPGAAADLPVVGPLVVDGQRLALDVAKSRVTFHVRTRWGQRIAGHLPVAEGERRILADGRHQVRVELDATGADLEGPGSLDEIARGERFFHAAHHPRIVFLSDPYPAAVVEGGGAVQGWLQIRGVRRPEAFTLEPTTCAAPGTACAVFAHGSIDRSEYGMDAMRLALTGSVRFDLQLWLEPGP